MLSSREIKRITFIFFENSFFVRVPPEEQDAPTIEFVYTGDTTFSGLLKPELSFIFSAEIFVTEATYLDGTREKSLEYGHIHILDLIENSASFDRTGLILLVHISSKYNNAKRVLQMLKETIPLELATKVFAGLRAFGHSKDLVSVAADLSECGGQYFQQQPGLGWATRISGTIQDGTIQLPQKRGNSMRICRYYLQGKCLKGSSCTFFHEG